MLQNIVILGAGFGGLRAALLIGRKLRRYKLTNKYRVILIDRNDYHTYTPILYEVATTAKELANLCELKQIVTFPILEIIRGLPIEFIKAEIEEVDLMTRKVKCQMSHVKCEPICFDYLIFALGSEVNYYNIPGLREQALMLKTFQDAVKIRENITDEAMNSARSNYKIVIGGAGSTGVELAGEIQNWLCGMGKNTDNVCWATITILEGQEEILAHFGEKISSLAKKRFDKLGAIRVEHRMISKISNKEVFFTDNGETIKYDLFIWAGGVRPNHLTPQSSAPGLYIIGDAAGGKAMVARAALDAATVASHNLMQEILFKEKIIVKKNIKVYQPKEYPYVIPIGGKYAIAKIGKIIISGLAGWILKGLVEFNYLLSIMPKWRALRVWIKGLWIFLRNDQLG